MSEADRQISSERCANQPDADFIADAGHHSERKRQAGYDRAPGAALSASKTGADGAQRGRGRNDRIWWRHAARTEWLD
jgi:hypothetical protein